MSEAVICPPGHGQVLEVAGKRMWIKARSADTDGRFAFWEQTHPRGYAADGHVHHEAVEAMYVLEGDYRFSVGGERVVLTAGGFLLIPNGVPHAFRVEGLTNRMLVLFSPGGYEDYWQELAALEVTGFVTNERRIEVARRYSTTPADD
jgi:mannose-6-phosphate isomerase-like protein (cupin superfamily)